MIRTAINNVLLKVLTNLNTRSATLASKQRGASALEYLVLAGALVGIMVFAFSNDTIRQTVSDIFSGLFDSVPST